MKKIIPAVLTNDFGELVAKFNKLKSLTDWVQVDIIDGQFVNNTSITLNDLARATSDFSLEADLMVWHPEKYLQAALNAKVKRFVFHLEAVDNPRKMLSLMGRFPFEKGISLNPETPLFNLPPYLDQIDLILLLGVQPGFQNQEFIPATLEKIRKLKELAPNKKIEVDGGIKRNNIREIAQAGADFLTVGSGLFENDNIKRNFEELKQAIADLE